MEIPASTQVRKYASTQVKLFLFIFLSVTFINSGYSQFLTDEEYHELVDSDSLSFKNQIDRLLSDNETVNVEFITRPRDKTGMFFLEQLIPVLKGNPDIINFKLTFPTRVNGLNESIYENKTDQSDMYHLMAVKEVYPEKYYDFLQNWALEILTESNDIFAIYKRLDMKFLLVLSKEKELHSQNEINNHRIVATKLQIQMPIVKLNSVIAEFPSHPFGGELCCDFFQCLKTQAKDKGLPVGILDGVSSLKQLFENYALCAACIWEPTKVSCIGCGIQLGIVLEELINIVTICKDPNKVCFGGVISCESVGGKDFFCNDDVNFVFQDKANGIEFFSYPVAECLECPTLNEDAFGIQIRVSESTNGAKPAPTFTYNVFKNGQLIDGANLISQSIFLDFEEYNPTIGDIFCVEIFADGCPNIGQSCFTYQGVCANSSFSLPIIHTSEPSDCGICDGFIGFKGSWHSVGHVNTTLNGNPPNQYGDFDNLCGGKYTLIATDEETGCTLEYSINFESKMSPKIVGEVNPSCTSINNGSITAWILPIDGKDSNFSFNWNSSNGSKWCDPEIGCELTELPPGNYCLTVTDNINGCSSEKCFDVVAISSSDPLTITVNPEGVAKTCRQENTGKFFYSVSGGVAPYKRAVLSNGGAGGRNIAGQLFTHLPKGDNCITITDYCGESTTECVHIERADPIEYTVTVKNTCLDKKGNDLKTGKISITGDYKLEIKNGTNGQLSQGSHTIVVTDETGCSTDEVVQIGTSELTNCHPDPENCLVELCDCEGEEVVGGDLDPFIGASTEDCTRLAKYCPDKITVLDPDIGYNDNLYAKRKCNCTIEIYCKFPNGKEVLNPVATFSGDITTQEQSGGTGTKRDPYFCFEITWCNMISVKDLSKKQYSYELSRKNLLKRIAPVDPIDPKICTTDLIWCDDNGNGIRDSFSVNNKETFLFSANDARCDSVTIKNEKDVPCSSFPPIPFDLRTSTIQTIGFIISPDTNKNKIADTNPAKELFKVFPNPNFGNITILTSTTLNIHTDNYKYKVINPLGIILHESQLKENKTQFNIDKNINSGLLFIVFYKNKTIIKTNKIIYIK